MRKLYIYMTFLGLTLTFGISGCGDIACKPGESFCYDSTTRAVCMPDGMLSSETCSGGCDFNTGQCNSDGGNSDGNTELPPVQPQTCTHGARQCTGTVSQVCVNGTWTDSTDCGAVGCNSSTGSCNSGGNSGLSCSASEHGKKSCIGDTPYICMNGKMTAEAACIASQTCSNGVCVNHGDPVQPQTCTHGARQCTGTVSQVCVNGTWTDSTDCGAVGCNSSTGSCNSGGTGVGTVGSTITFGRYEQDNDTTNGKESIEWRVLDKNADGQLLVISEKVLEVKNYNEKYKEITWEDSTIRSWLNGYDASYNSDGLNYTGGNFIDTAFTAEEQAKIVASTVPAHKNPNYSTSPGNATIDKIFLLSIVEANEYFENNASRQADATRYAVKQGVGVMGSESGNYSFNGSCTDVHCYTYWWLRSPGDNSYSAANVNISGAVDTYGDYVDSADHGVRPALWLNY